MTISHTRRTRAHAGQADTDAAVDAAEKKVAAVLGDLEEATGADVQDIGLQDMVHTDPASGRPVVKKGVDIDVRQRAPRDWLR